MRTNDKRRRSRIVERRRGTRLDDVPDHRLLRRAEKRRVDEVARRRDEGEERPRHDPGAESGSVTRRNACVGLAYRSFAASRSRGSICSSATYSGSAMKGKKLYVIPETTANVEYRSPSSAPRMWRSRRSPITGPWSARMFSQASVRTRYVTKNGAMMLRRKRFLHGPARKAIQ